VGDGKMNSMIKPQNNIFSVSIVLLCFSFAKAGIFSSPLPSLNGLHTGSFGGPGPTADADFQTEFQSIDEVRIHLIGTYMPGIGHYSNGQPGSVYGELTASMTGWAVPPRILSSRDTQFDLSLRFYPFLNPKEDWLILMDGEADIRFWLLMGTACDVIDQAPQINLTFAELIIVGTAIPEPTTLLMLGLGGLWSRKRKR